MSEGNWGDSLNLGAAATPALTPAPVTEIPATETPVTESPVTETPVLETAQPEDKPAVKSAGGGAYGLAAALGVVKKQAETDKTETDKGVAEITENLAVVSTEGAKEEDEGALSALTGLHPEDVNAEIEITQAKGAKPLIYQSANTFDELPLTPELRKGVLAMKYERPSKIQAQALPIILDRSRPNLIGQAHHGSGKTAAYSLGMLSIVDSSRNVVQALCVVPTRELAIQVHDVVTQLGQYNTQLHVFKAIKGSLYEPVTAQIVVGTPGTILAKMRAKEISKEHIMLFVADEADQMIDMQGLGEQTMKVKKQLRRDCQVLLFSATFSDRVAKFANTIAPKATQITVKREDLSLDAIKQFWIYCQRLEQKFEVLTNIYGLLNIGQSIIFVHTVATAKELTNKMRGEGYDVSLLHGQDMQNEERDKVMDDFRNGKTTVLITTNVLARGIDVLQVTLVVNYDIPLKRNNKPDPETYIHRIGRSGRFGRKGVAINLVHDTTSHQNLLAIANYYEMDILRLPWTGELATDMVTIEGTVKKALEG